MSVNRLTFHAGAALAVLLFSAVAARASRLPRIELLREVSVAGTRVFLSDLLPASAPQELRARASQISMGAAPQPGGTRVLQRDAVERQTGETREMLAEVSIPESIRVSSAFRSITLNEVYAAIREALKNNPATFGNALQPEDIFLESQVFVGPGDSGLRVMRMDFDRGLKRTRFLLWPANDPKVLPFFVTAQWAGDFPTLPFHSPRASRHIAVEPAVATIPARPVKAEILVGQGERATLRLHSDALQMFVDVVSLERGALGQRIRVRMADTGKILSARVDGRAHLEVKF